MVRVPDVWAILVIMPENVDWSGRRVCVAMVLEAIRGA